MIILLDSFTSWSTDKNTDARKLATTLHRRHKRRPTPFNPAKDQTYNCKASYYVLWYQPLKEGELPAAMYSVIFVKAHIQFISAINSVKVKVF